MVEEEIIEEGLVIKSENGIAEIQLRETKECEECTAKLFCKPGGEKTKLESTPKNPKRVKTRLGKFVFSLLSPR
ncbi:MAG: hypothetical protein ABIG69_07460 [Bacteroidota bacterium]